MNVEELINQINAKKIELIENGQKILDANELNFESSYMVKFTNDEPIKLFSANNQEVEFKKDEIYTVDEIKFDYTTKKIILLINLKLIVSDSLYRNNCNLILSRDLFKNNVDIYKVSEQLVSEIVIKDSVNISEIVDANKKLFEVIESIHSKLILRSGLVGEAIENNTKEIQEKIDGLKSLLNAYNSFLINVNNNPIEETVFTVNNDENENSVQVINLEKLYIQIVDAPSFIKSLYDLYEYKKSYGVYVLPNEMIRTLAKTILDYDIKLDTISLNKILNTIALDDLKEYLELILK